MMQARRDGYGVPLLLALVLHALVMAAFVVQWNQADHKRPEPVPRHMVASVIQEENKAVKQRQQQAKREAVERQKKQAAKAKEQQRKQAEQKRKAQEKAKREQQREKKAQQQREALALKKRQQEAKRQAQQEQARQEEQRRQQQLAEEQALLERRQREQALAQQLQAEAAAAEAAKTAATHIDMIRAQIESAWRYPPAVQKNQQVSVRLTLVPTGEVVQVEVVESSGNRALDRSVEQAVKRASPLPVPQDIRVFEQQFRSFTMNFRPENAVW